MQLRLQLDTRTLIRTARDLGALLALRELASTYQRM